MQSKVIVSANDEGNVISTSAVNQEYGFVRLQQQRVTFTNSGWVQTRNLSTLLHGRVDELQTLGLKANQEMQGKIVIKEQTEPFNETDPDRDLKYAGDTGIICCVHGEPIYRKTFYVTDSRTEDVFVAHDNGDAIRAANAGGYSATETAETVEVEETEASFEL